MKKKATLQPVTGETKVDKLKRILRDKVAGYDLEAIEAQLERLLGSRLDKAVEKYYNEGKEEMNGEPEQEL